MVNGRRDWQRARSALIAVAHQMAGSMAFYLFLALSLIVLHLLHKISERAVIESAAGWLVLVLDCGCVLALGYWAHRHYPQRAARWVWLIPTIVFSFAFSINWHDLGFAPSIMSFLAGGGPGEEGLEMLFFTAPAVSASLYSLGATVENWRKLRN